MATILVVEDEIALCDVLRADLEAEGHVVYQAFDGPSALALVAQHRPQLVILDWMLPGLDGLAVCRRITERHGGLITAMSKPGEGSTFTVVLPLYQPKVEEPQ